MWVVLGLVVTPFILFLFFVERGARIPRRPANISSKGVLPEVGASPLSYLPDERMVVNADIYEPPAKGGRLPRLNEGIRVLLETE